MITLQVKVKPNSRVSLLEPPTEGQLWSAKLKSPPVDGKANQELIRLIADYFDCAKDRVTIRSGAGARIKLIRVDDSRN